MTDRRRASLLDFAILASIAVLPLLLGVLLAMRSAGPPEMLDADEGSHISVRRVAALETFERAVVARDAVQAKLPDAEALLAYVPECATDWGRREALTERLKAWFGEASAPGGDGAGGNSEAGADPARDAGAKSPAERLATQLAQLDDALLRMSSASNRRVADTVGLDVARWAEAARAALATPVHAGKYPGRTFSVRCSDLESAVATLARGGSRMLARLAWRGSEVQRTVAHWRPGQYVEISPRHLARGNPWGGIAGCVYLWNGGPGGGEPVPAYFVQGIRSSNERVCRQPSVYAPAGAFTPIGRLAPLDEMAKSDELAVADVATVAPVAIAGELVGEGTDDARWRVPPSLHALLQPLDTLQRTSGSLYRVHATQARARAAAAARDSGADAGASVAGRSGNRVTLDGAEVDVGYSVDLTIDPSLQALAQKTAACYTGRQEVCRSLALRRAEDGASAVGHRLLEQAVVRMAAIAIVDVASGRIEALAGALSPCTRQEYDGPGRDAGCDHRLPYPIRYRPDALLNPAVFHDAMPASTVKPVMAAAFLSNATVGARWLASERAAMRSSAPPSLSSLRGQLMRSSSARFLDRMFCADQGFRPCERPWEIQAAARAFGWNAACTSSGEQCGRRDLLSGRSGDAGAEGGSAGTAAWVSYGRLMVEPVDAVLGAPFLERRAIALDTERIKRCAAGADGRRGSRDDWEKCKGGVVVDVVAEGWGQGHARASALGAAGMMASLAAAANGQGEVRRPHLVHAVRGITTTASAGSAMATAEFVTATAGSATAGFATALADPVLAVWAAAPSEPVDLSRDAAELILDGLSYSHRHGTARLACEQVLDARTCRGIDWIAGKTGTPTFPNDERSLDELAALCAPGAARTVRGPSLGGGRHAQPLAEREQQAACGGLRPYKWYVAAYRGDPTDPRWTKAIGVLTERNWLADSGRIHGAGDHGPNPASEIALQVIRRHVGVRHGLREDAR